MLSSVQNQPYHQVALTRNKGFFSRVLPVMISALSLLVLLGTFPNPVEAREKKTHVVKTAKPKQVGIASWYGPRFHGRKTANGERFNQNKMTAAHRGLPLGTKVKVTNLENGRKVVVRINDRGPYKYGRIIDLSRAAAKRLAMHDNGTARVRVERIQ